MKDTKNNHSEIKSDVQSELHQSLASLNWVGMGQIQSAIQVHELTVPCALDLGVNLHSGYRGIHMSRLYLSQQNDFLFQKLNFSCVNLFLQKALDSQAELSSEITSKISLQFPMKTLSLKSQQVGFRNYPVQVIFQKSKTQNQIWIQFEVLYSSTCPQSASLSMEVLKSETEDNNLPQRLPATPHAQRSRAVVQVQVVDFSERLIENFIQLVESTLKTPVQTAVKKADEMEFARLNAQNLMFCEDAARTVAKALLQQADVLGFRIFCEHQESLHPHNASSVILHNFKAPESIGFN